MTKATEVARLDQRRLLLNVNHKGTILQVNPGKECAPAHSACYRMFYFLNSS